MIAGRSRWRARSAACVLAAVCATTAGCGQGALSAAPLHPSSTASSGRPGTSTADPAVARGAACVTRTYKKMTTAQRVGQLFLVGVSDDVAGSQTTAAEREYHFGSLLLPQDSSGTTALATAARSIQALAPKATSGARFFIAANQEGGEIQQLTGSGFATMASELEQGSWSASTLRKAAKGWGADLRAAGVNLDLAPVMDVVPAATAASNAPIGALDREYGSDPAANGTHGTAFIQGMAAAGVLTVAKHFPGLGQVTGNTDFTANVTDNVTTAEDQDLNSFGAVIGAGVPFVMVALATYTRIDPARLAVFSPVVMRLLRDRFGFNGVIISDDLGDASAVQAIPAGTRATDFLTAGGDLITSQSVGPAEQMAAAVLAKASDNTAFRATVDTAARRVLAAKQSNGLLSC